MKLKSITIEGMHNVVRKTYDLSNLTYLHGPNGAGKSTIMQAIQLALLGYIPGTAKTKSELFRHANSHTMATTLVIDDAGSEVSICRIWTGTAANITSKVDIRPEGYDVEKIIAELELPIFNFNEFIGMTANKLKDWFINFLPSAETKIDWEIALREDLIVAGVAEIDEDLVKSCAKDIVGYGLKGTDEIRKANEYFKNTLSFKKKEAERIQSTIQSLVFYDDIDSSIDETEVRNAIADHQKKMRDRDLIIDAAKRYEFMKKQLDEYSDCTFDCADNDTRHIEAAVTVDSAPARIEVIQEKIKEITKNASTETAKISHLQESNASMKAKIEIMQSIIDSKGICPFTSTSCESVKDMISQYEKEVASFNEAIDSNNKSIEILRTKRQECQAQIDTHNREIRMIQTEEADARRTMQSIKDRYKKYEQLKEAIGEPPVAEFDGTDYAALIKEQQDLLVKIEANKKYNELIETLTADKFKIEQEIVAYNSWIKLTGVNGLQNDDSATKPFINLAAQMDKYIQTVFGPDVTSKFNLEAKANSFSFGIERKHVYIPFNLLSSGEKCLYTLALMISLVDASKSPLKIVMVDDLLDHLDDINIEKLFESLKTVESIQMIYAGVKTVSGDYVVEVK
ncbi:MAG: AAA family ATPase [Bacteroidaceae bacterium]|nr:AAA family ATPase [Bacteroidaceae bacterium]